LTTENKKENNWFEFDFEWNNWAILLTMVITFISTSVTNPDLFRTTIIDIETEILYMGFPPVLSFLLTLPLAVIILNLVVIYVILSALSYPFVAIIAQQLDLVYIVSKMINPAILAIYVISLYFLSEEIIKWARDQVPILRKQLLSYKKNNTENQEKPEE
jgi:hypothetical protein